MQKQKTTYKLSDIRGNLLQVKDPYGRTVFEHVYDLRAPQEDENGEKQPLPPLWTKHIDSDASVTWWDVTGKVIRSEDEKGAVGLSAYGALSRPSFSWAKDNGLEDFTVRMALVYGDDTSHGPVNPKTTNHWGQAYKNYDESGLDTILAYDFKGNVLSGTKQVIKDSLLIDAINAGAVNNWEVTPYRVDWTTSPWNEETNLLEGNYETDNVFDALNRPTETTYPADINHVRKVATTTYNRAGALQKLAYDGVDYIEHIAYDAKGGVIMTAYGNGIMTRSLYDRVTFRLKRVRTSAFTRSGWTFNDNAGVKEDKVFTYDLQGNIVSTHDKCTDCGLPSSPDDLTRNFTYDSIYRLLTATGRESNTQPSSDVWNDAAPTSSPNAQNCRTYTQAFEYDKLGNILKKIHTATGNNFTRRYNYQAGTNQLLNIDNNQSTPTVIASFSYDVKGNQTLCQSEKHYEWDYADRMRAFYNQTGTGVEPTVYAVYLYDGGGNRTKKLVRKQGGVWESVTYVGGSFEYHKKGTEEKNYTQIANVEIRTGSFTGDGAETTLYQLKDHLGSVGLRLNHSGTTIDREEYYPFGDSSLRTFTKKRYRYCGKEKDEESGLYYYGARYYMSWAARFISIDPLAADYAHLTPYNYAGNKPITYYDIDGMQGNGDEVSTSYIPVNDENISSATENYDGTINVQIGNLEIQSKNIVEVNGIKYYEVNQRIYKTEEGYSTTGSVEQVYSFLLVRMPDHSFDKDVIDNLNTMCESNSNSDCWTTYKRVAAILTNDSNIANISWKHGAVTDSLKSKNAFVISEGQIINWNYDRSGNENYGFDKTFTSLVQTNLENQPNGTYVFAVQLARQYHNVTVIVNKTDNNYDYQAFDQGTGWFTSTPQPYNADDLNEKFSIITNSRVNSFGGKEIHSRIFWYSSGKNRYIMTK